MKKLLKTQFSLKASLEQALSNYKKTGESRRRPAYLSERIRQISGLWTQFQENHLKISIMDEDKPDDTTTNLAKRYNNEQVYADFEALYFDFLGELEDSLEKRTTLENETISTNNLSHARVDVKLPRIDLPKFDGTYKSWRTFHDMFTSLIHGDTRIHKVQKLHYLKSCLTGEAEQLLKQYDMTEANYECAWNALIDRFNNTRVLINTQMKELLNQQELKGDTKHSIKGLLDKTKECLHELRALNIQTDNWDPIILYTMVQRLPTETRRLWEQEISKRKDPPSLTEIFEFLESRFRTLEALTDSNHQTKQGSSQRIYNYHTFEKTSCIVCQGNHTVKTCNKFKLLSPERKLNILQKHNICVMCFQRHQIGYCQKTQDCPQCRQKHALHKCWHFKNMTTTLRQQLVIKHKLCMNCLNRHLNVACPSKKGCFKCGKHHHTLLHFESTKEKLQEENTGESSNKVVGPESVIKCHYNNNQTKSLLATARVIAVSSQGLTVPLRALIDLGSQSSFITEAAYQTLKLKGTPTHLQVSGLGSTKLTTTNKESQFIVQSSKSNFKLPVTAYVVKSITKISPPTYTSMIDFPELKLTPLADQEYATPGTIDLLLGVKVYAKIISDGVLRIKDGSLTAQNTKLGWILFGELPTRNECLNTSFSALIEQTPTISSLDSLIKKFWEIEDTTVRTLTKEEKNCEQFYNETTTRLPTGKYQVRIPFRNNETPHLGDSRRQALSRFLQLEKKFRTNNELKTEYVKCLKEYIELGHMEPIKQDCTNPVNGYYMPHHAVIKDSTTTKVRVVFDASARTTTGLSLNEQMLNGPTMQPKLFATLLRWRKHKYAMSADVKQMYRMIQIHPEDRKYQKILWRENETDDLKEYELTTVTFGTTSAPYLAIKTLQQLAKDEERNYPKATTVVKNDFYVDDLLTGTDTMEEAVKVQHELLTLLSSGGFHLRKWVANNDKLLENIPKEDREVELPLALHQESQVKALGINWHPTEDKFSYAIRIDKFTKPATTKRNILSEVAMLYDPMGWIAPCIILAKIIMQRLWTINCSWDELIPSDLGEEWTAFKNELQYLRELRIPRWIKLSPTIKNSQIHAFCDASTRAFAAVAYIRVIDENDKVNITLLSAKTKVAPIKPVSLPRLELCAAVLLSRLLKQLREDLELQHVPCFCWSDSQIVLAWLNKSPNRWQTFVANRIGEIQENNNNCTWGYIKTKENPADIATRGLTPKATTENALWWSGPSWLKNSEMTWLPESTKHFKTSIDQKTTEVKTLTTTLDTGILDKFSNFEKTVRITAYCLRFIAGCQRKLREAGRLTNNEIQAAKTRLIQITQHRAFGKEIQTLKTNKTALKNSTLKKLSPILDKDQTLRVGGRLSQSQLCFNSKHPIILPKKDHLTDLIIEYFHRITLHGGAQLVLTTMKIHGIWIINGMHTVKAKIFACTVCTRHRHTNHYQQMGDLPKVRVTPTRPFENVGLDYAGPITLRMSKHRGSKQYKGYICVFVCMATKAAHIEVVSDLTSEAFIAAFRRFVGRRGLCRNIYSDNGTTFVGANKALQLDIAHATSHAAEETLIDGVTWHFNPPAAPHMGGLWEACVKSIKHHLKRTLQTEVLTFEELNTLLIQIEACINSRPLSIISDDASSLEPLTPGHFLIGTTLLAPPETELQENISINNNWKRLQLLKQQFWKRWTNEYLTSLQQRQKWHTGTPNVQIGQIVLLKDNKLPPQKWVLGRILQVHPGHDGKTRVVTVKTESALLQRPISKLCPLIR